MTSEEQLGFWIEGKSIHNGDRKEGECCPDFSCCFPGLLAPNDQRVAFRDATGTSRKYALAVLEDLDKDALVQILTKPKNAIIRQYQKLFDFESVRLKFTDDSLEAIAALAMERKVGARGLRTILEDLMPTLTPRSSAPTSL